jgi:hypothetical protein
VVEDLVGFSRTVGALGLGQLFGMRHVICQLALYLTLLGRREVLRLGRNEGRIQEYLLALEVALHHLREMPLPLTLPHKSRSLHLLIGTVHAFVHLLVGGQRIFKRTRLEPVGLAEKVSYLVGLLQQLLLERLEVVKVLLFLAFFLAVCT